MKKILPAVLAACTVFFATISYADTTAKCGQPGNCPSVKNCAEGCKCPSDKNCQQSKDKCSAACKCPGANCTCASEASACNCGSACVCAAKTSEKCSCPDGKAEKACDQQ